MLKWLSISNFQPLDGSVPRFTKGIYVVYRNFVQNAVGGFDHWLWFAAGLLFLHSQHTICMFLFISIFFLKRTCLTLLVSLNFPWRAGLNLVQNEYRSPHRDLVIYEEPKLCYFLQTGYWYSQVSIWIYLNSFSIADINLTFYVTAFDNNSHKSFRLSMPSHDIAMDSLTVSSLLQNFSCSQRQRIIVF